jgi:hypothetical protein
MSLAADSTAQLAIYAQLGVGFAGFAGVIGAFSKFRIHIEATVFRVRAMVALALMEVLFSLLPMLVAGFGVADETAWRICAALLATAGLAALAVMAPQARRLYQLGRLLRTAAYVLCAACAMLIAPLYATGFGFAPGFAVSCYFAFLFFGMVVCAYHFFMVMVAVRLDESEG